MSSGDEIKSNKRAFVMIDDDDLQHERTTYKRCRQEKKVIENRREKLRRLARSYIQFEAKEYTYYDEYDAEDETSDEEEESINNSDDEWETFNDEDEELEGGKENIKIYPFGGVAPDIISLVSDESIYDNEEVVERQPLREMSVDRLHLPLVSSSSTRSSSPSDIEVRQILRNDVVFEYIGGEGSDHDEESNDIIYMGTFRLNTDGSSPGYGSLICLDEIPIRDVFNFPSIRTFNTRNINNNSYVNM